MDATCPAFAALCLGVLNLYLLVRLLRSRPAPPNAEPSRPAPDSEPPRILRVYPRRHKPPSEPPSV